MRIDITQTMRILILFRLVVGLFLFFSFLSFGEGLILDFFGLPPELHSRVT